MQLASKMRFISAQYIAYLSGGLWKECASHSNRMARELQKGLKEINGIKITQKVEANGVFVIMPDRVAALLSREYFLLSVERADIRIPADDKLGYNFR
jgi:threonine aldolase